MKKKAPTLANCVEDLKKLRGMPPYDTTSNYVQGDAYFAKSIDRNYSEKTYEQALKIVNAT